MALTQADIERIATALQADEPVTRAEFDALRADLNGLRSDVKDIAAAWKAATGLVSFIKTLAALSTALAIIWAALHPGFWTHKS